MNAATETTARTINEILDRFEREVLPTLSTRTRKDYAWHIRKIRPTFGTRIAGQLVRGDIEEYLRVPAGSKGAMRRNRSTAVLSSALARAVEWGWVTYNVCLNVRRNPASAGKRSLTAEEFEGVRKLAKPRIRLIMDLAMFTRQPPGNLVTLRWEQVHDHYILFRDPKTKRKVEIEITPEIRTVLDRCKDLSKNSDYVVSTRRSGGRYTSEGLKANWQRLMKKWELTGNDRFTFHQIRDSAEQRYLELQGRKNTLSSAVSSYPQFERALREEAAEMAEYYQVFYCLEQKIRRLIVQRMKDAAGTSWWDSQRVPTDIKLAATKLRQREVESGITPRSDNMIDYTSFGELSGIISSNWDIFEGAFNNKAAVSRVMHSINLLRGPIAHCCAMSKDEIHRLAIAINDWFRQVKN